MKRTILLMLGEFFRRALSCHPVRGIGTMRLCNRGKRKSIVPLGAPLASLAPSRIAAT